MAEPTSAAASERYQWDVFLAHAGPDGDMAERLFALLSPQIRVFLDSRSLLPGDNWDLALRDAQRASRVTVVLVSPRTDGAYYEREEIAGAIALARENPGAHRLVPVYLTEQVGNLPYGLRLKHGIDAYSSVGLEEAAEQLRRLIDVLRNGGASSADPNAPGLVAREATVNGIYLTRIINPPGRDTQPDVSTVWLSAKGRETYIVDSITIQHWKGNLLGRSPVTGVQPLDAEDSFGYREGQLATHALNPALVLAPDSSREVSFNVRLEPEGDFRNGGGALQVAVNYHTLDGDNGTLAVINPRRAVQRLAKMLGEDVIDATTHSLQVIVTPRGVQRGNSASEPGSTLIYARLYAPRLTRSDIERGEERRLREHRADRLALNRALEAGNLASDVASLVRTGDELGVELARGWVHADVTEALEELVAHGTRGSEPAEALYGRHWVTPSADLARALLNPAIRRSMLRLSYPSHSANWGSSGVIADAAAMLAAIPMGSWASAIVALAREPGFSDLFDLVNIRRDRLSDEDRQIVDSFCRDHVATTASPRASALDYLAWRGSQSPATS